MLLQAITIHDKFIIIKENNLLNIQECPGILATRGGSHLTSDIPLTSYHVLRITATAGCYLLHDSLQERKDYALLRELRRASPTPIRWIA